MTLAARSESLGRLGGGVKGHDFNFETIFSISQLVQSWREFAVGKRHKSDVAEFSLKFIENISQLHHEIFSGRYRHSGYKCFKINDQKPRQIHKASVRDRIVHHAIHQALYWHFDCKFIYDSYSCRVGKGAHKALDRFRDFARKEGHNHTRTVWVLKCDIRKCFASIDHQILKSILRKEIKCPRLWAVLDSVIDSFHADQKGKGIPLGNLTSQLFVNVYLNELDQHFKRVLKARRYIRYADDFLIISHNNYWLTELLPKIAGFASERLFLELRLDDRPIRTFNSGIDFLGWVHLADHRVIRNKTKWRIIRRLENSWSPAVQASYKGLLSHGNTYRLRLKLGI